MKIRMRARISGTRDGADWPDAGGTISLDDAEADALVAAGMAVPVRAADDVETAVSSDADVETRPARRARG